MKIGPRNIMLASMLCLSLPVCLYASSAPDLCAPWQSCSCNRYDVFIENTSDTTWYVKQLSVTRGVKGPHDAVIKPGAFGFVGASASGFPGYHGPKVQVVLTDNKHPEVTITGAQNYCGFEAGAIQSTSDNEPRVTDVKDEQGSYKTGTPGATYFLIKG